MNRMRLGLAQRVVAVTGIGVALLAIGDYITSLGSPVGWTGYAPLMRGFPGGMSAGPRLALWLVLTALWLAVSLFILREQVPASDSGSPPAAAGPGLPPPANPPAVSPPPAS